MWMCIFIDRVNVYKKHLLGKFSGDFHIHAYDNASSFIIKIFTDQYLHPEDSAALFIVIYVALGTFFYKKYLSNRD